MPPQAVGHSTNNSKGDGNMTRKKDNRIIEIMHPDCCGLDVHKKSVSACLLTTDEDGKEQIEVKEFGTFTRDLVALKNWLLENQCPIVAIESTGGYWRTVQS